MTRNEALNMFNLNEGYTEEEVKKAYKKLMKEYHPDSNPNISEEEAAKLNKKTKEIGEAYELLYNKRKREVTNSDLSHSKEPIYSFHPEFYKQELLSKLQTKILNIKGYSQELLKIIGQYRISVTPLTDKRAIDNQYQTAINKIDEIIKKVEQEKAAEVKKFKKRMDEIRLNRYKVSNPDIEIAGGDPVLKSDAREYTALKTLTYIIEHDLQEVRKKDYDFYSNELKKIYENKETKKDDSQERVDPVPQQTSALMNLTKESDELTVSEQPSQEPAPAPTPISSEEPEEELVEVKEHKIWNWVKNHKKEIIIGCGIIAITIAVAIAMSQILPAITAASKASQIGNLTTQMIANSKAWPGASAAFKEILHGSNVVLANTITSLTGAANTFTASSGIWTIGGQSLTSLLATSEATLTSSLSHIAAVTKFSTTLGVAGLGTFGAGLAIPKTKSKAYKKVRQEINQLKRALDILPYDEIMRRTNEFTNEIKTNDEISYVEKDILLKKLKKISKKVKPKDVITENNTYETQNEIPGLSPQRAI